VGRRVSLSVLLPLALLALWTAAVHWRWVTEGIIPPPAQVARSWYQWIVGGPTKSLSPYSGTWVANVLYSGRRVLEGFLLAAAVGIPLGLFVGWNRLVARLVDPSIQLLRPVPITAGCRSRSPSSASTTPARCSSSASARSIRSWSTRRTACATPISCCCAPPA
jgi:ABC-type nitrate/sulfonate/bicarbonate transport system permease component